MPNTDLISDISIGHLEGFVRKLTLKSRVVRALNSLFIVFMGWVDKNILIMNQLRLWNNRDMTLVSLSNEV